MDNTSDDSIQGTAMLPEESADSLSTPRLRVAAEVVVAFGPALTDRVAAYAAALEAHRFSVGEPRPVEHPLVEAIVAAGGMDAVEIVPTPPIPEPEAPPPPPPAPPLGEITKLRLVEALGAAASSVMPWRCSSLRRPPPISPMRNCCCAKGGSRRKS